MLGERRDEDGHELPVFRGDDADCLVDAGLACRACLSGEVDWELEIEQWEAHVRIRCRACDHRRTVALTSEQALRLYLRSPAAPAAAPAVPRSGLALVV
jgi:hypothetical protein